MAGTPLGLPPSFNQVEVLLVEGAVQQRRSLSDHHKWLRYVLEQLEFHPQDGRPLPVGITRFNYFDSDRAARTAWLRLLPDWNKRILRLEGNTKPERPSWRDDFIRPYHESFERARQSL